MSKPQLQLPSQALAASIDYVDANENYNTQDRQGANESKVLHAFQIDNLGLLMQADVISELLTDISICSLPNTNQGLHGMGNLRGNIIPVFDLRYLFGMPESKNKYVLAIGQGEDAVAVLLDEIPLQIEVHEQYKLNALPLIPSVLRPHVNAAYHSDGLWVDCNLVSFFESLREHIK